MWSSSVVIGTLATTMTRLSKGATFRLLLLLSVGFDRCQGELFDAAPEHIKACAVDGKCDDGECGAFANSTASFVVNGGFYQYVSEIDADGRKIGIQYAICACNYKFSKTGLSGTGIFVRADSICKINKYQLPLPEDSTTPCIDKDSCHSHCNDVTFGTSDWAEAIKLPEGGYGLGAIHSQIDKDCVCLWGEERIVGCTFSSETSDAKPIVASGLVFTTAVVMGVMTLM